MVKEGTLVLKCIEGAGLSGLHSAAYVVGLFGIVIGGTLIFLLLLIKLFEFIDWLNEVNIHMKKCKRVKK